MQTMNLRDAGIEGDDYDDDMHADVIESVKADRFHDHTITTFRDTDRPWYRRRAVQVGLAVTVFVGVILAIAIPAAKNKKLQATVNANASSEGGSVPFVYKPQLPQTEINSNKQSFTAALTEYYTAKNLDFSVVLATGTPQAKAFEWVCGTATYSGLERGRRVQRFALGTFYYSTYQQTSPMYYTGQDVSTIPVWTSASNWMSEAHECDWEGIDCEEDKVVTGILLRQHQLSGVLPNELGLLESLLEIDLTSNFVYVDGEAELTPFSNLNTLQSLEMEDNFVSTKVSAIPSTMSAMTSLQKLVLSYNILQGPLNGDLFAKLSQLTHLEIESNFIQNDFPTELAKSTSLVYLYARRNLMSINLAALLDYDTIPSIFAVWLDSNTCTGGIPTTIGNHTDLASLSITNATLTGPIPSELGDLTGLRRVWLYTNQLTGTIPDSLAQNTELEVLELYENKLTGTMPGAICTTVSSSDYEFKALSADCEQVACQNCCTQCY